MIFVIYDDNTKKSEIITDIIGDKGFGDVVVRKRHLEDYYKENIQKIFVRDELVWKKVKSEYDLKKLLKDLESLKDTDTRILHCFSNFVISDKENASLSFQKIKFIDKPYLVLNDKKLMVASIFPDVGSYLRLFSTSINGRLNFSAREYLKNIDNSFEIEGLVDIGIVNNFIQCITGNFEARYFNSLKGGEYTIVKSSNNKKKIKAEYTFYHLLPEDMKYWFVMPFDYKESEDSASYTMERLHMTDLAIKWVHGSMNKEEFEELMDKYFYFFKIRHTKECSKEEYKAITDNLYEKKVRDRINDLKKCEAYSNIEKCLSTTQDANIDNLLAKYLELKEKIVTKNKLLHKLAIGHGDPCFSNAMYNKSTKTLKFIDPKGALVESELWTNPYYDIAKLSHSVCGRYDFFNSGLFEIIVNKDFTYNLEIPFDNTVYKEIFKKKAQENGFDYLTIRIYEASLFLSMLPLHMDDPFKVFGFILNARNILKEIEENV